GYMPCPVELDEYFDDIIGVTFIQEEPIQTIIFAGSPREIQFIITKPLHWTQRRPNEDEQRELHHKYPKIPSDWLFITIECKWNYELITTFYSFGERIMVLSPEKVIQDIKTKLHKMSELYK
ncbi:MAG: hypothetical protein J6V04_03010, partial [Bacteroidales bacterium]|nr:hypothetical protein [Bacteroidales bacterium]